MKFPVSPTLITYMARSTKLPPCAETMTTIYRGYLRYYFWLIYIIKYNPKGSNNSPALVFKPVQQSITVTELQDSLGYGVKYRILHLISLGSKNLLPCPMIWNLTQHWGGQHG